MLLWLCCFSVGKVLDGNRCVEVSECSCVHRGRHFPPGSTISQDCNTWWGSRRLENVQILFSHLIIFVFVFCSVCRHGSWECTNEGCPGEKHVQCSSLNVIFVFWLFVSSVLSVQVSAWWWVSLTSRPLTTSSSPSLAAVSTCWQETAQTVSSQSLSKIYR